MISHELTRAVIFSIPLISALVCLTVTAFDVRRSTGPVRRKIHFQTMTAYGVFALNWTILVAHELLPGLRAGAVVLFLPAAILSSALLLRMVHTMTGTGDEARIPRWHLLAPAVMALVRIRQFQRRVTPARKKLSKGASAHENSHIRTLERFYWIIALELISVPVPVFGMLLGISPFTSGGLVWFFAVLPPVALHIMSCFYLLDDNYMILGCEPETVSVPEASSPTPSVRGLTRERVDRYIDTRKPWLNPSFRLSDLSEDLYSNRAYVSAFINSEYGMNFNRFVNHFRLEEVERLREEALRKRQRVSMLQLILNAGFSSYRSYLRAKEARGAGGSEE
jgi:AraC-like DNA-binding protein